MVNAELWLTYQLASRAHLKTPSTTQLIELEFQNQKLVDLEDVLDHGTFILETVSRSLTDLVDGIVVFRQGFIEGKYRPATWWEKKDGQKVKGSLCVDDLLQQGVGRCSETALKLIVRECYFPPFFLSLLRYCNRRHPDGIVVHLCIPPQHRLSARQPACQTCSEPYQLQLGQVRECDKLYL